MNNHDCPALQLPKRDQTAFAVVNAVIFECHYVANEDQLNVLEGQAMFAEIGNALVLIPFESQV